MECSMEIKRDEYLNRLIQRERNGLIKVITGIRRCGKSYLLNTLFYNHLIEQGINENHIIKFAFDSAEDLIKIGEDPLKFDNSKEDVKVDPKKFLDWLLPQIVDKEMYYILLDEVQLLGAFESVLNGFLRKNNLDIFVTGSNSKFLSKDVLTEFEDRGDEVHVLPLSFSEYYAFVGGSQDEAFDDYSVYGGLPQTVLKKTEEQKTSYLMSELKKLYVRDLIRRHELSPNSPIGEVMDVIASGISSLTNPKKIADTFLSVKQERIGDATVDRYIEHMEDAFIVSRAKRYDVKGRKYIGTPYKLYFEDIGLRNARLNFRQIEQTHIMENIIYNELRFRGYQVDVGVVESRERDKSNKDVRIQREIDFIASLGSKKYYIQSAYEIPNAEKYEQETKSFDGVSDSFKKILIVDRSMKPRTDEKGYVMMGIKEFLLNKDSLNA